ncbi:hypothetical protein VaNZ11_015581 [Volvox africanus]|uniref:FAD-binding PCMH-type domain-containing protein n=1 Tax=Volvox africanus TaxID=51714 RepID=A0ABQ5SMI8_9CHLO|nr:hypothetical protein VaNZ11_015581 [Volvox africanus]
MSTYISHDVIRKLCTEIYAETGKRAHVVDATWNMPAWNNLLNNSTILKPGRPSCYFQPRGSDDVVAACRVAARHGLKISARGSGHHYGGASLVEGSLLLDLSVMRSAEVDPATRTARVGPAVTAQQLRSALAPHGLHFPLPHLSDVGLSGYLLGGGNGWGVRHWGAAADNVEEIEVVLLAGSGPAGGDEGGKGGGAAGDAVRDPESSCRLVRVRSETNAELFWGLRGGGFFLGVVTEFVLNLHPVASRLPLIKATYPLSLLSQVSEFFWKLHTSNSSRVEASLAIVGAASATRATDGSDASGNSGSDSGCSTLPADGGGSGGGGHGSRTNVAPGNGHASPTDGRARAVVLLSCHAFADPESDEVEVPYGKLRAFLPEARLSFQEGTVPYEEALSVLDASWNWPGLCMYGHGIFVPVSSLHINDGVDGGDDDDDGAPTTDDCGAGGVVATLAAAAASLTSDRSILLLCPSAPSRPESAATQAVAPAACGASGGCSAEARGVVPGALGFRDTLYLGIYAMWSRSRTGPDSDGDGDGDGDAAHVAWVRLCSASLEPYTLGLYVNEVMHDEPGQVRRSYEELSYMRLQALKKRVDPSGLLRAL